MFPSITAPDDIEFDEVHLATLVCTRLLKNLQGTFSIGLQSLVTGVPDPQSFFGQRFHVMNALVTVLGTVSARPSATESVLQLRRHSHQLQESLGYLQNELQALPLALSQESPDPFRRAKDVTCKICDLVAAYATLLTIQLPLISETKELSLQSFDATLGLYESNKP